MLPKDNVNERGINRRNWDLHQKILRDLGKKKINIFQYVTKQGLQEGLESFPLYQILQSWLQPISLALLAVFMYDSRIINNIYTFLWILVTAFSHLHLATYDKCQFIQSIFFLWMQKQSRQCLTLRQLPTG